MSNSRRTTLKRAMAAALTAQVMLGVSHDLSAQVGHPPESSPYRDLRAKRVLSMTAGYLSGSSGTAQVGPGSGPFAGARFDIHLGGPAAAAFGLAFASLDRTIINPTVAPEERVLGTASQSVMLADAGIDLLLTGEKSWHRMIPYVGASLGLALGGAVTADSSSGFKFATQFKTGPHVGLWMHSSDRITFRVEARDVIWRLKYPSGFFANPAQAPDTDPVLDSNTMKDTQWVHHLMLTFAVGFSLGL